MPEHDRNLDYIAARYAQEIVKEAASAETLERLATKALAVLQAQGVYALVLFLCSRTKKEKAAAGVIRKHLIFELHDERDNTGRSLPGLDDISMPQSNRIQEVLDFFIKDIAADLDRLLLVRDLYEQTLIYVRFGAKAVQQ